MNVFKKKHHAAEMKVRREKMDQVKRTVDNKNIKM